MDLAECWQYDSSTDTWTQKAPYPGGARTSPLSFAVDGKGYIVSGGYPEMHNDCWRYDPVNDAWEQLGDFPGEGRYTAAHFVLDDKVYMVGGYFNGTQTDEVWVYDTKKDLWKQLNDFDGGTVQGAIGFEIGGDGYIVAGTTGHTNYVALKAAWRYLEEYDTWQQVADFPGEARIAPVSFVIGGVGFVGLGANAWFYDHYNDFYGYIPSLDTWVPAPSLPAEGRRHAAAVRIGNKIYVGTGVNGPWSGDSTTFFNDLYSFGSPVGVEEPVPVRGHMTVSPTLVNDHLNVNMPSAGEVRIFNAIGQHVWQGTLERGKTRIATNELANGCYFITANGGKNALKFIVQR